MVDAEAIGTPIHEVLPTFSLTCNTVHCLSETAVYLSSDATILRQFFPLNVPIALCNSHSWCSFLFLRFRNYVSKLIVRLNCKEVCTIYL